MIFIDKKESFSSCTSSIDDIVDYKAATLKVSIVWATSNRSLAEIQTSLVPS